LDTSEVAEWQIFYVMFQYPHVDFWSGVMFKRTPQFVGSGLFPNRNIFWKMCSFPSTIKSLQETIMFVFGMLHDNS
jgi:hypothetical protein